MRCSENFDLEVFCEYLRKCSLKQIENERVCPIYFLEQSGHASW
jgi:hypothetical protein